MKRLVHDDLPRSLVTLTLLWSLTCGAVRAQDVNARIAKKHHPAKCPGKNGEIPVNPDLTRIS